MDKRKPAHQRWIVPDDRTTAKWIDDRERTDRMLAPFGQHMLAVAALQPGEIVLDIGCGTGATSVAAWECVAPSGSVTGVDISPAMLEAAGARAASLTQANITWLTADAQTCTFPSRAADAVISRFGLAHFVDTTAAFTNLQHALRVGGRFVFTEWTSRAENEWMYLADEVVRHTLPERSGHRHAPTEHARDFADEHTLYARLVAAGFRVEQLGRYSDRLWIGRTPDDVLAWFARLPEGRLLEALAPEARRRLTNALRGELERRADATGVYLAGNAWIVCCRV
jgi:ubiquinone/menaquinone biosynthesis C-methylase UbiE